MCITIRTFFTLLTLLFLSPPLFARTHAEAMKSTLDQIAHSFEVAYAPTTWKGEWGQWRLDKELQLAKEKIDNNPDMSLKDFQRLIRDFVATTRDYHVGVRFYSTEKATLPLEIKGAEGRYFITSINRRLLPVTSFPYQVGDEVLTFDDFPVEELVNKLQWEELGSLVNPTDKAIAQIILTHRSGRLAHKVPKGCAWLQIRRKGRDEIHSVPVNWVYDKEKITPPAPFKAPFAPLHKGSLFEREFISPLAYDFFELGTVLGQKKSFVPDLGKKVWQSSSLSFFNAYIFLNPNGERIGYIRLPRFNCHEEEAHEFKGLIDLLNSSTSALVVDLVDNPGGNIFYLYTIASMLANEPLHVPPHNTILTQETIAMAYEQLEMLMQIESEREAIETLGETIHGYPVTVELVDSLIESFYREIHEWNEERYFTLPIYLYGIEKVPPHTQGHYTKPILLLINSLDFSAGDFLPAILQDNKRATLFGSRTAGAGGYIIRTNFYNRFGIEEIRLTGSIATRLNDRPIENLGVTPDIPYEITAYDLENNYADYKAAVLKALDTLKDR